MDLQGVPEIGDTGQDVQKCMQIDGANPGLSEPVDERKLSSYNLVIPFFRS
jgi:hypothetical protein